MLNEAGVDVRCQYVFDVLLGISKHQLHGRKGCQGGHLDIRIHLFHHAVRDVQLLGRIRRYEGLMNLGEHFGQFVQ